MVSALLFPGKAEGNRVGLKWGEKGAHPNTLRFRPMEAGYIKRSTKRLAGRWEDPSGVKRW